MTDVAPNTAETISFLRNWPAATLQLTAIHVDPVTHEKALIEARSFDKDTDLDDGGAVEKWVDARQGKANLYFTVNTLTGPKNSKANKRDVQEVIALHVDIDVEPGVDQEAGSAALLEKVRSYKFEPSVIISSGGGVQAFWILQQADRIPIGGDIAKAEAAECYTRALEADFGADHCHNVDRIMRLPGTINVPDIKKIAKGRVARLASLLAFSDLKYPLQSFASAAPKGTMLQAPLAGQTGSELRPGPRAIVAPGSAFTPSRPPAREPSIDWDEALRVRDGSNEFTSIESLRAKGVQDHALLALEFGDNLLRLHERHAGIGHRVSEGPFQGYSEILISIATALCKAGLSVNECAAVMSSGFPGNKHVAKQKDNAAKRRAVMRSLGKAMQDLWLSNERERALKAGVPEWAECVDRAKTMPLPTMRNAKIAMESLGIVFARDLFHAKTIGRYNGEQTDIREIVGEITDDVLVVCRSLVIKGFDFDPGSRPVYDAVLDMSMEHAFNPVLDMLDEARALWIADGSKPRLNTAALTYWGAEDTPLNRSGMEHHLLATVARARFPGCKYDVVLVQEGPQGIGKSTSIEIVVGTQNFSAQKILGINEKQQAEQVRGVWGYEIQELAGMQRADMEDTKSFVSRTHDNVRRAYGKVVENVPRTNTFWGSTNDDEYLQDPTGNRRFLPLKVGRIDLDALKRDRLLLLGEADYRIAQGESWNIPESLWGDAAVEQEKRRLVHPWENVLANIPRSITIHDHDGRQEVKVIYEFPCLDESTGAEIPHKLLQKTPGSVLLHHFLAVPLGTSQPFQSRLLKQFMTRTGWQPTSFRVGTIVHRGYQRIVDRPAAAAEAKPAKATTPEIPF